MYVVDTDVLSLTNTATGFSTAQVEAWRNWVEDNQHGLYLSVATIMEIRFGIEKCRGKGATKKAARLEQWLAAAESVHSHRVIPVSIEIAHKAGELLYKAVHEAGMTPSTEDAIIVATAELKGYTVLSRNQKHMKALQADWLDPIQTVPPAIPTQ